MTTGPTLQVRRDQMVAAVCAVDGLGCELWRASSADLEAVMAEAARAAGATTRVVDSGGGEGA